MTSSIRPHRDRRNVTVAGWLRFRCDELHAVLFRRLGQELGMLLRRKACLCLGARKKGEGEDEDEDEDEDAEAQGQGQNQSHRESEEAAAVRAKQRVISEVVVALVCRGRQQG